MCPGPFRAFHPLLTQPFCFPSLGALSLPVGDSERRRDGLRLARSPGKAARPPCASPLDAGSRKNGQKHNARDLIPRAAGRSGTLPATARSSGAKRRAGLGVHQRPPQPIGVSAAPPRQAGPFAGRAWGTVAGPRGDAAPLRGASCRTAPPRSPLPLTAALGRHGLAAAAVPAAAPVGRRAAVRCLVVVGGPAGAASRSGGRTRQEEGTAATAGGGGGAGSRTQG